MAAMSSSTVAPHCGKGAVSFDGLRVEKSSSLRSGAWQMGSCSLSQLRGVVSKAGACAVVRERGGVVTRAAADTSSGMIRVSVGLVRGAEFLDGWGAFSFLCVG